MKFARVLVLEVEAAKDKHRKTPGGKYRRDTPWLVRAFQAKGLESDAIFITKNDTAASLVRRSPDTGFLGRVIPMDYPEISWKQYVELLTGLKDAGCLIGPDVDHMDLLGSKMILYRLKNTALGMGDGIKLHEYKDLEMRESEIDEIISPGSGQSRVLKMMRRQRSSNGLGVWKLDNAPIGSESELIVTDAYTRTSEKTPRKDVVPRFVKLCSQEEEEEDAVSMPFLPLVKDNEFRFLVARDKVLEIVHKRTVGESAFTSDALRYGAVYTTLSLIDNIELVKEICRWSHDVKRDLGLVELPYWWSVDCVEEEIAAGEPEKVGRTIIKSFNPARRLVLMEINCSCVDLVADSSAEAEERGLMVAEMIAKIVLN